MSSPSDNPTGHDLATTPRPGVGAELASSVVVFGSGTSSAHLPTRPGQTLLRALAAGGVDLARVCDGSGLCGACRVRVVSGSCSSPSPAERLHLSAHQLANGVRLACQARPTGDVEVMLLRPLQQQGWRPLAGRPAVAHVLSATDSLVVAVDLGTTHIRASLWAREPERCLGGLVGDNPQASLGGDVVARLVEAQRSPARRDKLQRQVRTAVGQVLSRLCEEARVPTERVERVVIVGNTAMLALFADGDASALLDPINWERALACVLRDESALARHWGLATDARVDLVPPVAGFVGSDLLAAVLATGLVEGPPGSALVDFGTNSEIALWDGERLWVTAAAGGPAFEGAGISWGLPAIPGAVYGVQPGEGGGLELKVIGDEPPAGLCGSGLVSAIAQLVELGSIRKNGRLGPGHEGAVALSATAPQLTLSSRDVDVFQRAKAAIGAGLRCLHAHAQLPVDGAPRLCVCGAFGEHLDPWSARRVGLLPPVEADVVELHPEAALQGAERIALAMAGRSTGESGFPVQHINLATDRSFDQEFVRQLLLCPMHSGDGTAVLR